jgi:hypothetical protein
MLGSRLSVGQYEIAEMISCLTRPDLQKNCRLFTWLSLDSAMMFRFPRGPSEVHGYWMQPVADGCLGGDLYFLLADFFYQAHVILEL